MDANLAGQNVLHVDANLFSGTDFKLAWLLLLPAWNLLKGWWQALRRKPEDEMEMVEEEEEEDPMGGGGMDAATMQKMVRAFEPWIQPCMCARVRSCLYVHVHARDGMYVSVLAPRSPSACFATSLAAAVSLAHAPAALPAWSQPFNHHAPASAPSCKDAAAFAASACISAAEGLLWHFCSPKQAHAIKGWKGK